MHSDDEADASVAHRNPSAFQLERFLDQSHMYFTHLAELKTQLNAIDRLDQPDSYVRKLNQMTELVHGLTTNIRRIEDLHTQLTEDERLTLDHQIYRLCNETDREMNELHRLRQQVVVVSPPEITERSPAEDEAQQALRQQHAAVDRVNESYDSLERDLALLRETIDEIATLLERQEEALTNLAQNRAHSVSSLLQQAVRNQYVAMSAGAVIGALTGGPIGLMMGTKVGALAAATGSAFGAVSMSIAQQRVANADDSAESSSAYNQAML